MGELIAYFILWCIIAVIVFAVCPPISPATLVLFLIYLQLKENGNKK